MKLTFNPTVSKISQNYKLSISPEHPSYFSNSSGVSTFCLDNMSAISGKSLINLYGNKKFTHKVSRIFETESTKRVRGEYKWPVIKDIKALMIAPETQTFMKVGGLAEVVVQLSNEFNKKMSGTPNKMQIMTPLYSKNEDDNLTLVEDENGQYTYKSGKNEIHLEKVTEYPVETFDIDTQQYTTENVGVFVGKLNGTEYVFLQNKKYFDITPENKGISNGPYVKAENKVESIERMLFFSKAAYQLLKNTSQKQINGFETPNIIISNDWTTSTLSTLMRFVAPLENSDGKLDSKTYDYLQKTPIIHIAHCAVYIGKDLEGKNDLLKIIFGKDQANSLSSIKGYMGKGSLITNEQGQLCAGLCDLHAADRIVAVSPHYAEEIAISQIISGNQNEILKARHNNNTLLGITNGYEKSGIEPSEKNINSINSVLKPDMPFIPFADMYNDQGYEIKMENKSRAIRLLNSIAQKATTIESEIVPFENSRKLEFEKRVFKDDEEKEKAYSVFRKSVDSKYLSEYSSIALGVKKLINPENCHIDLPEDISNIPFIASIGRLTYLKGYDNLAASIKNIILNLKPWEERPIIAISGNGDKAIVQILKETKEEIAKIDPVAASRIFIFDGYNQQLRDALCLGSDFFLIPSKTEACGLTQMEAMSKGSIPIASAAGGLVDTIADNEDGFLTDVFYDSPVSRDTRDLPITKLYDNGTLSPEEIPANNIEALTRTVRKALDVYYEDPERIKEMSIKAMKKDFSWSAKNGSIDSYINLMRTGSID